MTLTPIEQRYLAGLRHGRLATVGPDGTPQVKPVGFTYNAKLGTVDIAGLNMANSAKYRNVQANLKVAFVVDDVRFEGVEGVRFLEIRGIAEPAVDEQPATSHLASEIIRIHPRRGVGFNIDPDRRRLPRGGAPARAHVGPRRPPPGGRRHAGLTARRTVTP